MGQEGTSAALARLVGDVDLQRTLSQIQAVARDPASDRTLAALLVGCIAVAVALLVLFALMLVTPSRKRVVKVRRYASTPEGAAAAAAARATRQAAPPKKPPSRLYLALTGPAAVTVLVVLAFASLYAATSLDAYCAKTCHASQDSVKIAERVDHSSCRSCHEGRLVLAAPANSISRLRMAANQSVGIEIEAGSAVVDSATCLRCHDDVLEATVVGAGGIAMSHKEVADAGVPCVECHTAVGHAKDATTAKMSDCVTCHDSQIASAECESCHKRDPVASKFVSEKTGRIVGTGKIPYPAVRAANRDCGTCHDLAQECDGCHGIRMPHTRNFKEGGHARAAAYELKVKCYRCHDPSECGACHGGFNATDGTSTHGANWKAEHKRAAWDAGCVCHTQRSPRKYPICYRCHTKDRELKPITP